MLSQFFKTPGSKSSEYLTTILTVVWYVVNAWQDWVSTNTGVMLSAPALVYIISRGLAKYEQRNEPPAGTAPPAA